MEPDVEYVEPNYVTRVLTVPNDPFFTSLWGLFNDTFNPISGGGVSGADIDAPGAWDLTTGTRDHVVAVLDTGIDYSHPDLAANMWSAPTAFQVTIGGVTTTCGAGTHGYNAFTHTCDPMDDHFHGTHVAGTIGARGNNGVGVTGVNWTTSMMAVKILSSAGTGTVAEAVAGMEFVLQAQAAFAATGGADVRVLSNSWTAGGGSTSVFTTVKALNAADMLFVAAAGNDARNADLTNAYCPACYSTNTATPNVVAVAASTSSDQLASFSNYGPTSVQLAAPGTDVLSTVPGNAYAVAQGTSMAAPHVSGAAMLALSVCDLSAEQLKSLLLDNVDPVPALSSVTSTGGRLNARAAVQNCPAWRITGLTLTPNAVAPRPLGTTVTWTALAEGGQGPFEYRFYVWDGAAWSLERDWGSDNTFVWTPASANDSYRVSVNVRSAGHQATEMGVSKPFAIKTPLSSVTLTSDAAAPQGLGATVTWTAAATGGQSPYQYRWYAWDGVAWVLTQDWSSANTFAWTPNAANDSYKVTVHARSSWNTQGYEQTAAKPFAIMPRATSVTLTSDLASPQALGKTVTLTAVAGGGQAPYQYRWFVWDGAASTLGQDWSSSNTFVWTPGLATDKYVITAQARSAWNTKAAEFSTTKPFSIKTPVSSVTLTSDLVAPQARGATVTWTAAAAGGVSPYQYRWYVWDGASWVLTQDWSSANTFVWTPGVANADYKVTVHARSAWNTQGYEQTAAKPFAIMPPVTSVALTSNLVAPQAPNTAVTWTASAAGGQAPYQYRFIVWDGTTWLNARAWGASNVFTWTPSVANADYRVAVLVRSAWNTGANEMSVTKPFAIRPFATSLTLASALSAPQYLGTSVYFTATASGGQAPYEYQFAVWDGVVWTVVQQWSTTPTYNWMPSVANADYRVLVKVRSAWNKGTFELQTSRFFAILP